MCSPENFERKISFHARLSWASYEWYSEDHTLKFQNVRYNYGSHYNKSTGVFTASTEGTYVFLVSLGSANSSYAYGHLKWHDGQDDAIGCYALATRANSEYDVEMTCCQAVIHLRPGNRVWVQSLGDYWFWGKGTSFAGFRISQ